MAIPLALPLAPVLAPGSTAAAATALIGSGVFLAEGLYGFRRNVPALPPITGRETEASLGEMLEDALAGARVPVGFPLPPPWRPEGSATGLALSAAAAGIWQMLKGLQPQLWGLVSSRTKASGVPVSGPTGAPVVVGSYATGPNQITKLHSSQFPDLASEWTNFQLISVGIVDGFPLQESPLTNQPTTQRNEIVYSRTIFGNPSIGSARTWPGYSWVITPLGTGPSVTATEFFGGVSGPASWPYPWPDVFPDSPAPLVLPSPSAPPLTLPSQPDEVGSGQSVVPVSPTTVRTIGGQTIQTTRVPGYWPELLNPGGTRSPLPAETPALTPVTPFGPVALPAFPSPDPARPTQQTNTAGQVEPLAPQKPPTTAVDSIVPWPGAAPIPGTGPAPRPDLQGIAQEVGKIERKIEVMMNPQAPGNLVDRFGNLSDLIGPLVEAILALNAGTTYSLDSPCEVDSEGNKLPPVLVEAPGALTTFGAMLNRMDALAELLQVHKNLKQPNCKPKQPTGEFVTVNFEQID